MIDAVARHYSIQYKSSHIVISDMSAIRYHYRIQAKRSYIGYEYSGVALECPTVVGN